MAEGCLADLTKQPCLSHNAKVRRRHLVGPAHVQAGHDVGIGLPPIPLQLPAAVRQAVHPHVLAEPQFVPSVPALRLSAGAGRWDPDSAIRHAHAPKRRLEQRLMPGLGGQQRAGPFRPAVRPDRPNTSSRTA